ncbi:MAG: hypothetical protein F4124_10170 [Acidimicrobiia bacterium]|uniref:hypothetical protein n=1 Tax=Candidatus Poriferisocius sp. TaxID=3101276 RepID=UPI001360DB0C|nr:hypothetical protein [bacterium]MXW59555.1 hypothetical protein [Acidimicrobiia bacterium]MDE0614210.1 hypothetical protein [bacterium]MXZ77295.1 hypothetical protein [Acidimicrobiia bacterium]MXZ86540.1 hypothetical protein [Acidimicrobiia bacterium]
MSSDTSPKQKISDEDIKAISADFENRQFTPEELVGIKKTRRRSPRLGEARAEVYTFRAPPSYKSRIKKRAASDNTSESQVIRDALDSYL